VRSHLPVLVTLGDSRLQAGGLDYDHGTRKLELRPPIRAVFVPEALRR
jgi:hypothetical protein